MFLRHWSPSVHSHLCGGYFINFYLDFIEVPSYGDVSDFMINDKGWTLEYY